jgi:hypothetical protein
MPLDSPSGRHPAPPATEALVNGLCREGSHRDVLGLLHSRELVGLLLLPGDGPLSRIDDPHGTVVRIAWFAAAPVGASLDRDHADL